MQDSVASAVLGTVTRLPEMGPNKIQQALDDYDHMAADLASTKKSLAEYVDIANKLQAENDALKAQCKLQTDFLNGELAVVSGRLERLEAVLGGIRTRYKVIRECFAKCEEEALSEGIGIEIKTPSGAIGALPKPQLSA